MTSSRCRPNAVHNKALSSKHSTSSSSCMHSRPKSKFIESSKIIPQASVASSFSRTTTSSNWVQVNKYQNCKCAGCSVIKNRIHNKPASSNTLSRQNIGSGINGLINGKTNVNQDSLNLALWNAQSLKQKINLIKDFKLENNLDLIFITESWLKNEDVVEIGQLLDNGTYKFLHTPRSGRPGGGVACLANASLKIKKINTDKTKTFEHMEVLLESKDQNITFVIVYRPEPSRHNPYSMNEFYEEFMSFISSYCISKQKFVLVGDFNFHMNNPTDIRAKKFNEILGIYNLTQHVVGATHRSGNTLDLVISPPDIVKQCSVGELLSDHFSITFKINVKGQNSVKQYMKYRNMKKINIGNFRRDIKECLEFTPNNSSTTAYLNFLVNKYNSSTKALDKHAPEKVGNITVRKPNPWTNAEIKKLKAEKRKAEKKWKRSKNPTDYQSYKEKRNEFNKLLNDLKTQQLSANIQKNKGNTRALFKIINATLNRNQASPLPERTDDISLANQFASFFDDKINTLRSKLSQGQLVNPDSVPSNVNVTQNRLFSFRKLSQQEVKKLIMCMPTKHCMLDPLPTWLMKECIDEFLPLTTEIINTSLTLGVMPLSLKNAVIRPLLKKFGLELIMKNYRPVSNLSFLGKLIESAVITQFINHMNNNNLQDDKQSAYKKFHSTETLLTKVHNEIMQSLGKNEVVMIVLLDLSAAFDTIDHDILLNRLKDNYGIDGTALNWFRSYLSGRSQSVLVNDSLSKRKLLKCGVPQGSKLGPILFNSYIAPLSEISKKHGIYDEKYADDEQLLLAFKPHPLNNQTDSWTKMEKCIEEIRTFLLNNKLFNNAEKTEFLLIGKPNHLRSLHSDCITVDNTIIKTVDSAKNLGVIFDYNMNMDKQVNNMCKKAYYNLSNIAKIRKSLTLEDTKTVVNALVTPHLDYGNSLLVGISKKLLHKLQVTQNSAVRLICKIPKRENITPSRKELHWLPISARIKFKIASMVWKIINNQAPSYLSNLVQLRNSRMNVRSNGKCLLDIPDVRDYNNMIERCFSRAAPKIWNDLPESIRCTHCLTSFKKGLKTVLFKQAYE